MLHVISAQCVARNLHTIAPGPLEYTCWRRFAAHLRDCKQSRIAPLSAVIIIIYYFVLPVFTNAKAIVRGFRSHCVKIMLDGHQLRITC